MNGEDIQFSAEIVLATAKIGVPAHALVHVMTYARERVVENARDIVHLAPTRVHQHALPVQGVVRAHALVCVQVVLTHVPAVQEPAWVQVLQKLCQIN